MPQFPETRRKLDEAAFFLRHMEDEERQIVRNEPEPFGYYLSAFLSAGRSVTFVLQSESGIGKEAYERWFRSWCSTRTVDDQELLTFMNHRRVAEVHLTGAPTSVDVEMVPVDRLPAYQPRRAGSPTHPAYGITWSGPPGTPPPTVGLYRHSFDGHNEQTIPQSKRYLRLLRELVEAFPLGGS